MVSIITPVFNSARYIEATINSVLNQTYSNWEWMFVDGGSKDDSRSIIERFAKLDPRIKLVLNPDDKGPAHARYTGIKNSKGKYIAFLDADDLWYRNKLEIQVGEMDKKDLSFTYTLCRELQQDEEKVSVVLPTSKSFSYKDYLHKRGIYALTVMVKKDLLTDDIISIWNKDSYDDTLWWMLIMKKGVIAKLVPFDLALYRLSANQLSSNRAYTIKRVYSIYDYFSELNKFQKNIYFLGYLLNSGLRHFKLKLFPKKQRPLLSY